MDIIFGILLSSMFLLPGFTTANDGYWQRPVQADRSSSFRLQRRVMQESADQEFERESERTGFHRRGCGGNAEIQGDLDNQIMPVSGDGGNLSDTRGHKTGKVQKKRNLVYATVDGRPLKLDLFLPYGPGPHPLIVWIHGGGWQKGDKKLAPTHPARRQVRRGYAVASIQYRLSHEVKFPGPIHDCKAAIRWLRGNAQRLALNPERFAVWGSSAGGHLAALLGTSGDVPDLEDLAMGHPGTSSRVQAVVDWYGPTDFLRMGGSHNRASSPESLLIGCPIQSCPDKTAMANPIQYISPDDPPFFIQHGALDKVVPCSQSKLLHEALLSAGIRSTFIALEEAVHTDPRFSSPENVMLVEDFLDRVLQN